MPIVQHQLAFARPLQARVRALRRPFRPSGGEGPYRLPHEVRDRLTSALAPFRNRESAFTLATFLARYHSNPDRVVDGFMIDRRALAERDGLDLTEARVRGAIRTLEAVGFLERSIPPSGSRYKVTADGLHRKPIKFVFGAEYGPLFIAANKRARLARGGDRRERRPITPSSSSRPSVAILGVCRTSSPKSTISPKSKSEAEPLVNLGEIRKEIGLPAEPSAPSVLELALQRLSEGVFGKAEGRVERVQPLRPMVG